MRWKWIQGPDGQPVKQSNTRIIRWSDGSLSLQLGPSSNLFDIVSSSSHVHKPLHPSNPTTSQAPAHPTTYIVAHHQEAELLQSEGPITAKLTLVPANLKGDMHQKLAKSVKNRNEKGSRLKIWDETTMTAVMGDDGSKPAKAKRAKKPPGSQGAGGGRRSGGGGGGRRRGGKRSGSISSEDESEDDEELEERRRKG
jgi:RNA polymerase-associated protein LEO1